MIRKYFGEEDPMGKILNMNNRDYKVTGIIKFPGNSHMQIDAVVPLVSSRARALNHIDDWEWSSLRTYIVLQKDASVDEINKSISGMIKKHVPESKTELYLQPIKKIHLYSADFPFDNTNKAKGDIKYVYIFSAMALFILLIACINFMNLATARSTKREKEIGIRKVAGAYRIDIIKQFLTESVLLSFMALIPVIILASLLLPLFNDLTGKELHFNILSNITIILGLFGVALITGVVSGSYPALFLSSFQPVKVLKGALHSASKGVSLRRILIVIQFSFSIFLIIGSLVIRSQLEYIHNKDLGFEKENVLLSIHRGISGEKIETVKTELMQNPNIINVAMGWPSRFSGFRTSDVYWEGKNPNDEIMLYRYTVGFDYIETLKMEILQGRSFSREYQTDQEEAYIINEEAVKAMGLESPVGTRFTLEGQEGTIIGVVKNFHNGSLRETIEPSLLKIGIIGRVCVRIKQDNTDLSGTINFIEKTWTKFAPEYPFVYYFIDESVERFYRDDRRMSKIFTYFNLLAIFISCIGLFGLAAYMAEQRTKEIGIRKVLGASVLKIVTLLSKEFIILITIANIIAWPAAYYFMNKWLQNFMYRTGFGVEIFVFAGILALVIACITVAYQAVKAARGNPVDALKYE